MPEALLTLPQLPDPAVNRDFAFLYEGFNAGRLLVQKCGCGHLRFPPAIFCPLCHSSEWEAVESACSGVLHSYTVHHHPPLPPWTLPLAIGLADMDEGFRFCAAMPGCDLDALTIGAPVSVRFVQIRPDYVLPCLTLERTP